MVTKRGHYDVQHLKRWMDTYSEMMVCPLCGLVSRVDAHTVQSYDVSQPEREDG